MVQVEGTAEIAEDVLPATGVGEYVDGEVPRERRKDRLRPGKLCAGLLGGDRVRPACWQVW